MHHAHGCRIRPCRTGLRTVSAGLLLSVAMGGMAPAATPGGEWAGTLVTDKGTCPTASPSRLLVDGRDVSFVPGGGVLVLHGHRQPGELRIHAQLALTDMNKKPLPMVFEGTQTVDGSRIEGSYGTPACRAHVTLLRPEHHPLRRLFGN